MKQDFKTRTIQKIRRKGWLVTVKFMPEEFSYIIEGARSEYDAPSEDRKVGQGMICIEAMMMRHDDGGWFPQPCALHAKFEKALESIIQQIKRLEIRNAKKAFRGPRAK